MKEFKEEPNGRWGGKVLGVRGDGEHLANMDHLSN